MLKWTLTNEVTGDVYVLKTDPKGWDDLNLVHNRSDKYDGIWFDFSLEIAFGCKGSGKEFVDSAYDSLGSEADVSLLVQYTCTPVGLKTLFDGKLNFSSYKQEYKGRKLYSVVDIEKKGITQLIKNREKTDVDLCATESIGGVTLNPYNYACYDLNLHSKIIYLESELFIEEPIVSNSDTAGVVFSMTTGETRRIFATNPIPVRIQDLEKTVDSPEYFKIDITTLDQSGITTIHDTTQASPPITPSTYNWSIDTTGIFKLITDGSLPGATMSVIFNIRKGTDLATAGTTVFTQTVFSSGAATGDQTIPYDISSSGTVDMVYGDKLWVYWFITYVLTVGTGVIQFFAVEFDVTDFTFNINTLSSVPATTGKAVAIHEAWSRVCEGITDKTLAFKSDFFGRTNSQGLSYASNGYGSFTAIMDGLRIRGFTQSDNAELLDGETKKGILTNLVDMFDSCNGIWGIGLGIEKLGSNEVVRVEEKDYFYQSTSLLKIDNVLNIQMSFLNDRAYSDIEIGYEKWKPEIKGGLDEPNTIAKWIFTKIKSLQNTLSLLSPFIAGMYAIETTRRKNKVFKLTEDTPFDDDIFIIALTRNVSSLNTCEKNENITINSGLLSPSTAYNLRFNLFSNLDRVMNQVTTGLTKGTPNPINYSYFEGNGQMQFQFNDGHAGDLSGNAVNNVQNTQYKNSALHRRGDPILLPEQYSFTYPIPFDDYINILNNPYGYIEFSEGTQGHKKGYLKTLSYNLKRKMGEFTLIRKFE